MLPVPISFHLKEQLEALETDMAKYFAQNKAGELVVIQTFSDVNKHTHWRLILHSTPLHQH